MVSTLYIGEIAPPEIRGTLLVLQELCIVTDIVIAFYVTYGTRHIPTILMRAGVFFIPYSPRWLCQQGRDEESLRTLAKIRQHPTTDERVVEEWLEIRAECAYRNETSAKKHHTLTKPGKWNAIKLQIALYADCWKMPTYKRTQVAVGLMFFQQFVGINALIYYSPSIFERAICMFISHFVIAVLIGKNQHNWPEHTAAGWASVAFLLFFMLTFGATWGPIPWAMPAEIFPSLLRAKGCTFGTMSNWSNNFIIGLITPPMIQKITGTYVFFCIFCAVSFVWVYFLVPETNGRTLEQMDSVFKDRSTNKEAEKRVEIMAGLRRDPASQQPKAMP
ncbi:hypothetical protein N7481_002236 [Penicillium waksmanii]|uniref:uncharacterized protein n=1 Tax=Penicillium waksmanii TaxID=69791 RepID=UPI002548CFBC|nr:uncharacterized protein N7481_002236 [Penicillium waksmanii]KAJ5995259.1 hypothetical protein N7481_002236 [Penicillium waksmanii]